MKYLLDTHVLDWVRHADHRLSIKVQTILADAQKNGLAISDVTLTGAGPIVSQRKNQTKYCAGSMA